MNTDNDPELALWGEKPLPLDASLSNFSKADAALEFGRCRVLLRQRQLLADGVPVELGTRAFDLLLVLLEADGALVSKSSSSAGCGRASWCRKRTSRFRFPRCAKLSAPIATSSTRNSAAVTDSPVCSARMPRSGGLDPRSGQGSGGPARTLPSPASEEGVGEAPRNRWQLLRCSFTLS